MKKGDRVKESCEFCTETGTVTKVVGRWIFVKFENGTSSNFRPIELVKVS